MVAGKTPEIEIQHGILELMLDGRVWSNAELKARLGRSFPFTEADRGVGERKRRSMRVAGVTSAARVKTSRGSSARRAARAPPGGAFVMPEAVAGAERAWAVGGVWVRVGCGVVSLSSLLGGCGWLLGWAASPLWSVPWCSCCPSSCKVG